MFKQFSQTYASTPAFQLLKIEKLGSIVKGILFKFERITLI